MCRKFKRDYALSDLFQNLLKLLSKHFQHTKTFMVATQTFSNDNQSMATMDLQQWHSQTFSNGHQSMGTMDLQQWQPQIFNNDNRVWLSITLKISIKYLYYVWLLHPKNFSIFFLPNVGIKPLKSRHDVTKLDLIVLFLLLWCIDIDLSIQTMSLTLYMTRVY